MAFDKFKQTNEMRKQVQQITQIQKELRDTLIEATEADGKVKVVFSGEQKIEEVHIDASLLSPDKRKELEQYIKNCVSQAISQSQQVAAEKMKAITGSLGLRWM